MEPVLYAIKVPTCNASKAIYEVLSDLNSHNLQIVEERSTFINYYH